MPYFKVKEGIKIYYEVGGRVGAPYMVFLHGYGSSLRSMRGVADLLMDKYRTVLFDMRGHGLSDKPEGNSAEDSYNIYTIEKLADDTAELIDNIIHKEINGENRRGSPPVFIYGHSMGGMVALDLIIRYTDRIRGAFLGSTAPQITDPETVKRAKIMISGKIIPDEEYYKKNAVEGFTPGFTERCNYWLKITVEDKLRCPFAVQRALAYNIIKFNVSDYLRKINIPVVIIHGSSDRKITPESAEKLAEKIPTAKLIMIEGQNHEINKEVPVKVASILAEPLELPERK